MIRRVLLVACVTVVPLIVFLISHVNLKIDKSPSPAHLKKILFYTSFFDNDIWYFGLGHGPFIERDCEVSDCYITNNKDMFGTVSEFDAVLFHIRNINAFPTEARKKHQRYVFVNLESPINDGWNYTNEKIKHFFNWTMTYRLDSDVPWRYDQVISKKRDRSPTFGNYTPIPEPLIATYKKIYLSEQKTNLVSWLVSNCNTSSRREEYVTEMQKYIPVDVYGKCGTKNCKTSQECDKIMQQYKFYLAFENSFCRDYITEKTFNALWRGQVPVVMGGAEYSKMLPPRSYIDTRDFNSPKNLSEYLKYLDSDENEYLKYFWWRESFRLSRDSGHVFCDLCKKLHTDHQHKSYGDLGLWFRKRGQCKGG